MSKIFTLIFFCLALQTSLAHSASRFSCQFGQVQLSIYTYSYKQVQDDAYLLAQMLNDACKKLNIEDHILIDLIPYSGTWHIGQRYISFSKTEPNVYISDYSNSQESLRKLKQSDSLNLSIVESTIRICADRINLMEALDLSLQFLVGQELLDSSNYQTTYHVRPFFFIEKSAASEPGQINIKDFRRIKRTLIEIRSKAYKPLREDLKEAGFFSFYQDGIYKIACLCDSSVVLETPSLFQLTTTSRDYGLLRSHAIVFIDPIHFYILVEPFPCDPYSLEIHGYKQASEVRILGPNSLGQALGTSSEIRPWHVKWLYEDVFLICRYWFIDIEPPFIIYNAKEGEILNVEWENYLQEMHPEGNLDSVKLAPRP